MTPGSVHMLQTKQLTVIRYCILMISYRKNTATVLLQISGKRNNSQRIYATHYYTESNQLKYIIFKHIVVGGI